MNYIDAVTFLKQPKEVQKVFLDWWKPEMYDLFFRNFINANGFLKGIYKGCIQDFEMRASATKDNSFLPLLSETQLRKFIEEKLGEIDKMQYFCGAGWKIEVIKLGKQAKIIEFGASEYDLLQAYWEVACKIAKEL